MTVVVRGARQARRGVRRDDGSVVRYRSEREREGRRAWKRDAIYYVGLDGEGVTDADGSHRYVMLQWSSADGTHRASLTRPEGIGTQEALDFLLAIPLAAKAFTYAFNYDLTMFLRDLPDDLLGRLFRPEERKRADPEDVRGPVAVRWGPYRINLIGTKFSIAKGHRRRVIWDLFKFYQKRFTKALAAWSVCPPEVIKRIDAMKGQRSQFHEGMLPEMSAYCYDECAYLAVLADKLVTAHEDAGLELRNFYGAGSTAAALLTRMGIKDCRRDAGEQSAAMQEAVASSFFGGRFENSGIGVYDGPIYNRDICSAYPYQLRFLPCLDHGRWEHTKRRDRLEGATAALVEYRLGASADTRWGPFPFRTDTGSVVFPKESMGGHVWKEEYLWGEKLFSNVEFLSAWTYHTDCDCIPFHEIPEIYLRRIALGKDGAGIVLKLGPNSCYGKLAQSVGKPQYQSWIWAAMITSGTRAMLLQCLSLIPDWDDVLAFATDSIVTRCDFEPPEPRDTCTSVLLDGTLNKPSNRLGAWDVKVEKRSIFLARPGIFFPLEGVTEDDLESIRARGIGRQKLYESGHRLVDAWRRGQYEQIDLGTVRRFCGARTSTHRSLLSENKYRREDYYGQWVERPIVASLNPLPKRDPAIERCGDHGRLLMRAFPGLVSAPYRRALTLETLQLKLHTDMSLEQPDGMFQSHDEAEFELEAG